MTPFTKSVLSYSYEVLSLHLSIRTSWENPLSFFESSNRSNPSDTTGTPHSSGATYSCVSLDFRPGKTVGLREWTGGHYSIQGTSVKGRGRPPYRVTSDVPSDPQGGHSTPSAVPFVCSAHTRGFPRGHFRRHTPPYSNFEWAPPPTRVDSFSVSLSLPYLPRLIPHYRTVGLHSSVQKNKPIISLKFPSMVSPWNLYRSHCYHILISNVSGDGCTTLS